MQTFRDLDKHLGMLPAPLVNALTAIAAGEGRQDAFKRQSPMILEALREVAMIQSVEASNAIEDITVSTKRLRELALDKVTPTDRSESEIAGYRRVLNEIHTNAEHIPFTESVVKQFHGWLYSFTRVRAGEYKFGENEVTETHPDGTKIVRFRPVTKAATPAAMAELHQAFDRAWADRNYHPLLLLAAYVFDFLMIHPFQDGNGRMSRLMTSLLLYHAGFEVGRYVSWEKLIEESRETYYESLEASTAGWHDGEHDLRPWLDYFLGVLIAAYSELEHRVTMAGTRGSKKAAVEHFVRTNLSDVFTIGDVRRVVPHAGDQHIGNILRQLKKDGVLDREGGGQATRWRRLRQDF
jgi:Fic family protein